MGLVAFAQEVRDSRGRAIPLGMYLLCYAVQPAIKEHRGTSEFRDMVLLLPAQEFPIPARPEAIVDASRRVSGTGHPAVLALVPAQMTGDFPRLTRTISGRLVLEVRSGGLVLGLDLSGGPQP